MAQGAPERISDLQRISWHSDVVKAESDMETLLKEASGNVHRLRKYR